MSLSPETRGQPAPYSRPCTCCATWAGALFPARRRWLCAAAIAVLLRPRLIEFLQAHRFDYKGDRHPLSPSAIDQVLREVSSLALTEGLLPANERLCAKLALGVTVTEFMPDGKKHQPTVPLIDWPTLPPTSGT